MYWMQHGSQRNHDAMTKHRVTLAKLFCRLKLAKASCFAHENAEAKLKMQAFNSCVVYLIDFSLIIRSSSRPTYV